MQPSCISQVVVVTYRRVVSLRRGPCPRLFSHAPVLTASDRIPVTLLTGFLGSGKTTLLNRILREHPLTAVVINEFGETAIDHPLVEGVQGPLALLGGGCVCCQLQGDLAPTLKNLWMARSGGHVLKYERLVIETTGLADPAAVLATLVHERWLARHYQLDGVVTTVDAQLGADSIARHPEAQRQVAVADRLVVTKTDLVPPETVDALRENLRRLNPQAAIVAGRTADLDIAPLVSIGGWQPKTDPVAVRAWLAMPRVDAAPSRLLSRPAAAHSGRIRSFSLRSGVVALAGCGSQQPLPVHHRGSMRTSSNACLGNSARPRVTA